MSSKAKLELYHLALLEGENGAQDLVLLCRRNKMPQLSHDKWMVRFIESEQDDVNDRKEVRETELIPLISLSKDELRKHADFLRLRYDKNHITPTWVDDFFKFNSKITKAKLIEAIEGMWDDHSTFVNKHLLITKSVKRNASLKERKKIESGFFKISAQ